VVTLGLCLTLFGCNGGIGNSDASGKRSPSTQPTEIAVTPRESHRPAYELEEAFVGDWFAHSIGLKVSQDGSAKLIWRIYRMCTESPPPCDQLVGNQIVSGGVAAIQLAGNKGPTAVGKVLSSQDTETVPEGPFEARLGDDDQALYISPWDGETLCLRKPGSPSSLCQEATGQR
jgi:hypothetical protein